MVPNTLMTALNLHLIHMLLLTEAEHQNNNADIEVFTDLHLLPSQNNKPTGFYMTFTVKSDRQGLNPGLWA